MKKNTSRKIFAATASAALVATAVVPAAFAAETERVFPDVPTDHNYSNVLNDLYDAGVVQGYTDGTFDLGGTLTRAEASVMVASILDLDTENAPKTEFEDVKEGAWYEGSINALNAAGHIAGLDDGTFAPDKKLTRAELVQLVYVAYGIEAVEAELPFEDLAEAEDAWYKEPLKALYANELIAGVGNGTNFAPSDEIKRGDFAWLLANADYKFGDKLPKPEVPEPEAPELAVESVSAINNTTFEVSATFNTEVTAEELANTSLTLTNDDVTVTADFKELDGQTAVFEVGNVGLLQPGNASADGTYVVTSTTLEIPEGTTSTYSEILTGNQVKGFVYYIHPVLDVVPVTNATIKVGDRTVVTDDYGFYSIATNAGVRTVDVTADGFFGQSANDVEVSRNNVTAQNFELEVYNEDLLYVEGTAINNETSQPIEDAEVVLYEKQSGEWVEVANVESNADGEFKFANKDVNHASTGDHETQFTLDGKFYNELELDAEYKVVINKDLSATNLTSVFHEESLEFSLNQHETNTNVKNVLLDPVEQLESATFDLTWGSAAIEAINDAAGGGAVDARDAGFYNGDIELTGYVAAIGDVLTIDNTNYAYAVEIPAVPAVPEGFYDGSDNALADPYTPAQDDVLTVNTVAYTYDAVADEFIASDSSTIDLTAATVGDTLALDATGVVYTYADEVPTVPAVPAGFYDTNGVSAVLTDATVGDTLEIISGDTYTYADEVVEADGYPYNVTVEILDQDGRTPLTDVENLGDLRSSDDNRIMTNAYNLITSGDFFKEGSTAVDPRLPSGTYFLRVKDEVNTGQVNATTIIPLVVTEGEDAAASTTEIEAAKEFTLESTIGNVRYNESVPAGNGPVVQLDAAGNLIADTVDVVYEITQKVAGVDVVVDNTSGATFVYATDDNTMNTSSTINHLLRNTEYKATPVENYIRGNATTFTAGGTIATGNATYNSAAIVDTIEISETANLPTASDTDILEVNNVQLVDSDGNIAAETGAYKIDLANGTNVYANILEDDNILNGVEVSDKFAGVAPGEYTVKVDLAGFKVKEFPAQAQTVYDFQNAAFDITSAFEVLPGTTIEGYLRYADDNTNVAVADADVEATVIVVDSSGRVVDGYDFGTETGNPEGTYKLTNNLVDGQYTVIVRGPGFETQEKVVTVENGKQNTLNFDVTRGGLGLAKLAIRDEANYAYSGNQAGITLTDSKWSDNYLSDEVKALIGSLTFDGVYGGTLADVEFTSEEALSQGDYTLNIRKADNTYAYTDTITINDLNDTFYDTITLSNIVSGKVIDLVVDFSDSWTANDTIDYVIVKKGDSIVDIAHESSGTIAGNKVTTKVGANDTYTVEVYAEGGKFVGAQEVTVQDFNTSITVGLTDSKRD